MQSERLYITLRGPFSATMADGTDVTPTSSKAIALLALLAEAPTMRHGRRWLEDKLWSDRAPPQAQGSLRTALLDIRRSFATAHDVLGSDRKHVWLNPDAVHTDLASGDVAGEFLEGLDINDPEFNDWLIAKRVALQEDRLPTSAPSDAKRAILIQCGTPGPIDGTESTFARLVDDQVGKTVSGFIALARRTLRQENPDLIIRSSIERGERGAVIFVQVIDPVSDDLVHTEHCFVDDLSAFLGDQQAFGRFCWGIADTALEQLPLRTNPDSAIAVRSRHVQYALRNALQFDGQSMGLALEGLGSAFLQLESGLFLAFKAWVLMSMVMEEIRPEDAALLAEVRELLSDAERHSPNDAMVAAISASVRGSLLGDHRNAHRLAAQALREDANNIFALLAMSKAKAVMGEAKVAYRMSRHVCQIASNSKFAPMCNLQHSILCISMKRSEEAMQAALRAAAGSEFYRAPRRQLLALQTISRDTEGARNSIIDLSRIEPGFSVERFLFDRKYPVDTLRNAGYLDLAMVGLREIADL